MALSVSPELVSEEHALSALETASKELFKAKTPSGMQDTLDKLKQQFGTDDAVEFMRQLRCRYPDQATKLLSFTTQLGLKTLDPSDYNYRPNYNNSDRSADPSVSHGFNYHNGPEWVWPVGYFLDVRKTQ